LCSFVSCSSREARFTVSPIAVNSLRRGEPTLPVTASPMVQPDTDPQRPRIVGETAPIDLHEDLLCGRDGMMSGGRMVKRRAEDRHEAVAEEFVDEAACRSIDAIMKPKVALRNSTTYSGRLLRAFAVKFRMSRNITQTLRVSPVKSAGLASRRSTTAGETC
jgi:hypothetical protein